MVTIDDSKNWKTTIVFIVIFILIMKKFIVYSYIIYIMMYSILIDMRSTITYHNFIIYNHQEKYLVYL